MSDETPETAKTTGEPVASRPVPPAIVEPDAPVAAHRLDPVEPVDSSYSDADFNDADQVDAIDYSDAPVEPVAAETSATEPVAATADPAAAEVREEPVVAEPTRPAVQTVYVHAPVPPRKRGNRGLGSLIALLSAIVFAAIYAGAAAIVLPLFAPRGAGFNFVGFLGSPVFYIPVLVFAVAFILLVLVVNRASWWAYVLGSFIVALVVYFVSIGVILLVNGVIAMTPSAASAAFRELAVSPLLIIAAITAREVPIWFGAIIAARGRRQKVRNVEERDAFEREVADNRAGYDRAAGGYATN